MKVCNCCKEELEATEEFFYKINRRGKQTLMGMCITCCLQKGRERFSERTEQQKKRERDRHNINRQNRNHIVNQRNREKYALDGDKARTAAREWARGNPDKVRLICIKRLYKVDPSIIMDKMDKQGGCCDICGESLVIPESKKNYHIDHDHSMGRIRGLLCEGCNLGLGKFKEDTAILQNAIYYLNKYKENN